MCVTFYTNALIYMLFGVRLILYLTPTYYQKYSFDSICQIKCRNFL